MKTKLLLIGPSPLIAFDGTFKIKTRTTTIEKLKEKLENKQVELIPYLPNDVLELFNTVFKKRMKNKWIPSKETGKTNPKIKLNPGESCITIEFLVLQSLSKQLNEKSIDREEIKTKEITYRYFTRLE